MFSLKDTKIMAYVFNEELQGGIGYSNAIVCAGATAQLVQDDQGARRCPGQNLGRLHKLLHESTTTSRDVVGGPHPNEKGEWVFSSSREKKETIYQKTKSTNY